LTKPVDLGFACFDSREDRGADCRRAVSLNRRLTGDSPSDRSGSETLLDDPEDGATLEHCVVKRRLPEGRDALALLEANEFDPHHIDRVAERVARFHLEHRLGTPAPSSTVLWL
jgi:aminoglycoside phosphotransferase family enzyme